MTNISFFDQPEDKPFAIGSGNAGALLIHGFMGTPAEMLPLGTRLAEASWTAHGILLPGFGNAVSHLRQTPHTEWLAATAHAWRGIRQKHHPAVLIGFSMGGALALLTAIDTPPDLLILIAPFWRVATWHGKLLPLARLIARDFFPFKAADFNDITVRDQFRRMAPELDIDDLMTQTHLRTTISIPMTALNHLRQVGLAAYRNAPSIAVPTVVVQGKQDETVLVSHTRQLVARFKAPVQYHEIEGEHGFIRPYAPEHERVEAIITQVLDELHRHKAVLT